MSIVRGFCSPGASPLRRRCGQLRKARLELEELECRRVLAFLVPTLDLAWGASDAEVQYKYFPDDPVDTFTGHDDASAFDIPGSLYTYSSQAADVEPLLLVGGTSAGGRVHLNPDQGEGGVYAGFAYADIDVRPSFATFRSAAASTTHDMAASFVVHADANDTPGNRVNIRLSVLASSEGIARTSYSVSAPGYFRSDEFATNSPLAVSPTTSYTDLFQVALGETIELSWHASAEGSVSAAFGSLQSKSHLRVGLETLATDMAITGLDWALAPEDFGGVTLSHAVYEAPLTRNASVALYWAEGTELASAIGTPIYAQTVPQGSFDYEDILISAETLGSRPDGANYLLAVADPLSLVPERSETNNVVALSLHSDLRVVDANWLDDQLGVSFSYEVIHPRLLDSPEMLEGDTKVAVYWATGTDREAIVGAPLRELDVATFEGVYGEFIALVAGRIPPEGVTHILVIIDPDDLIAEADEDNNLLALPLPDLEPDYLEWNLDREFDSSLRGLDFAYAVNDADSRDDVKVAFYWADAPDYDSRIGEPVVVQALSGKGDEGYYGILNEPARWGKPPAEATHILYVVDPYNDIIESNEHNNVMVMPLSSPSEVLDGSVEFAIDGTKIYGYFNPGQGGVTMSEAEVALGVEHFNWVQQIIALPEHWDVVLQRGGEATLLVRDGKEGLPIFDPLDFIDNTDEVVIVDTDLGRGERFGSDSVDRRPFYYNEPQEIHEFLSNSQLRFSDEPQVPHDFLQTSEYYQFRIRLAGVGYQEQDIALPGVTPYRWKANTVYDADMNLSGGVFLRVTDDTVLFEPLAGGVFDLEPAQSPPIANPQFVKTLQNSAVLIQLDASDADGDPLLFTITQEPMHGTLSGDPPNVLYSPNSDYIGADSFSFQVSDGTFTSNEVIVSISVDPLVEKNRPPIANPGGPYLVAPGEDLNLNSFGSFDPDEALGDSIVSHEWDLQGDGSFELFGPEVTVPWSMLSGLLQPNTPLPIVLRVRDTFGAPSLAETTVSMLAPLHAPSTAIALGSVRSAALAWVPSPLSPITRVVRKEEGYPAHADDGTIVYEGIATSALDNGDGVRGLTVGTHYYSFFASDGLGSFSTPLHAGAEGTVVEKSGRALALDIMSDQRVAALGFVDSDQDGTIRAAELDGALEVDLLGEATSGENDTLAIDLDVPASGEFAFETFVRTASQVDQDWNLQISLGDGGASNLDFAFRYRYLFARSNSGAWKPVASLLQPNTQYRLSVVIDSDSGDVTVYWNENESVKLTTTLAQVSRLSLRNLGNAAEDLAYQLDDVRFASGAPAFVAPPVTGAGFDAADLNAQILLGTSWRSFGGVSLIDIDEDGTLTGSINSGQLALNVEGAAQTNENDEIQATFDSPISDSFIFETEFTTPAQVNQEWSLQLSLEDGTGGKMKLAFRFKYLFLRNAANSAWLPAKSLLTANTTYKLSVAVDTVLGTADVYVDDLPTDQMGVATSLAGLSQIRFANLGNATADQIYRFDNLQVVPRKTSKPKPLALEYITVPALTASGSPSVQVSPALAVANKRLPAIALPAQPSKGTPIAPAEFGSLSTKDTIVTVELTTHREALVDEIFERIGAAI
ncbi:MAG: hypothetical protein KDA42_00110 [Planctomycetales bacterium]|nr:hypothetical protein [Planctomycetales bacterium]